LKEDVGERQKNRVIRESASLSNAMRGLADVVYNDLEKKPMDVDGMILLPRLNELAARYAVFHVVCIIRALATQADEVSTFAHDVGHRQHIGGPPVPHMNDFFHFVWHDRKDILRKVRWP
jgi:hypothetical protein